jgi:lysophospholipid acyltransferase
MVLALIDQAFQDFGNKMGTPADQISFVFCLTISWPIGFIFKMITNATIRHLLSIILGFAFQFLIYRNDTIYPLLMALGVYFGIKVLGRNKAHIIFIFCMVFLSVFHIYRMIVDFGGYNMDVTTVLMINVCKCTSFAWCYKDGGVSEEKLSVSQRANKIEKLPSFMEYMSFIYFYGNTLVGPACEYKDHINFINRQGEYSDIPSTFLGSLGYLLFGFVNLAAVVFFSKTYNSQGTVSPQYAAKSFFGKFMYLMIAMQVQRCRYYTAWLLGTASVTSPGLNYNPSGKSIFERHNKIVAVKPIEFEMNDSIKDKLEAWNTASQVWLKNYVYLRIVTEEEAKKSPKKATFASNCTFMVSAFWHGFYLGYYFAFFWMFLAQQVAKSLFKMRAKLRWIRDPVGYVIRWFVIEIS